MVDVFKQKVIKTDKGCGLTILQEKKKITIVHEAPKMQTLNAS